METTLKVHEKAMIFTIEKEVFGFECQTFVLIEDITQFAAMDWGYCGCHIHEPSFGLAHCETKEGDCVFSGSSTRKSSG
ncbi:unnamed protein product [Prunus armeniaca]